MKITSTSIADVFVVEPQVFSDGRGFFYESYNQRDWLRQTGLDSTFVQSNHSMSLQGVLRGLHYQIGRPQAKLARVVVGEVFDVAVDLRKSSPTFGKWVGVCLSAENKKMLWIPEGFGHGFLVLSPVAEFLYKTTDFYMPEQERCILWNDPDVAIRWPLTGDPVLSQKDAAGVFLDNADLFD
ncbi:MAG TPA: dTDP-4-dehydrorhamnose 3,5-epimerase [Desulfopila sp.]|nr:dTDP-4-dehydrorhamnose 3,5-epimerase [Desulfopila sp.]